MNSLRGCESVVLVSRLAGWKVPYSIVLIGEQVEGDTSSRAWFKVLQIIHSRPS